MLKSCKGLHSNDKHPLVSMPTCLHVSVLLSSAALAVQVRQPGPGISQRSGTPVQVQGGPGPNYYGCNRSHSMREHQS